MASFKQIEQHEILHVYLETENMSMLAGLSDVDAWKLARYFAIANTIEVGECESFKSLLKPLLRHMYDVLTDENIASIVRRIWYFTAAFDSLDPETRILHSTEYDFQAEACFLFSKSIKLEYGLL